MILILRGHIRDSFITKDLYKLVKSLKGLATEFEIYIFTWSIIQSSKSWRLMKQDETRVTKEIILNYFEDLMPNIKEIKIEDDRKISLIGSTEGNVGAGPCPKIAWKNYWYCMFAATKDIYERKRHNDFVVNMRFDILTNYNKDLISSFDIVQKTVKCLQRNGFDRNEFITENACCGVDNIIFGSVLTQYTLAAHFHKNLDDILSKADYRSIKNQELLVFWENEKSRFYFL